MASNPASPVHYGVTRFTVQAGSTPAEFRSQRAHCRGDALDEPPHRREP